MIQSEVHIHITHVNDPPDRPMSDELRFRDPPDRGFARHFAVFGVHILLFICTFWYQLVNFIRLLYTFYPQREKGLRRVAANARPTSRVLCVPWGVGFARRRRYSTLYFIRVPPSHYRLPSAKTRYGVRICVMEYVCNSFALSSLNKAGQYLD